ncbi:MAG: QueT transporter family protein [Oscillospiraceae bacterium]|nr:QueT transporter family protein [Oscillospiraceae bacterium]
MNKTQVSQLTAAALIAAMYTALTLFFAPMSFGSVQVRVSEALTLLAVFSPTAVWGVTMGCFLSNLVGVMMGTNILGVLDVFFGTAATLLAAVLSRRWGNVRTCGLPVLSALPPIVLNGVVVGGELTWLMAGRLVPEVFIFNALSVAAGEAVSCLIFGLVLVYALEKTGVASMIFKDK